MTTATGGIDNDDSDGKWWWWGECMWLRSLPSVALYIWYKRFHLPRPLVSVNHTVFGADLGYLEL